MILPPTDLILRMSPFQRLFPSLLLLLFLPVFSANAQTGTIASQQMDLFLDCEFCDHGYIKQEFTAVNYVRAQQDADVHLLVTRQWTAGGGSTFELQFIGREEFEGMNNQLYYSTEPKEAPDEVRKGLLKMIRLGMVPYIARTASEAVDVSISSNQQIPVNGQNEEDPWKSWIYEVEANGNMNLESLRKSYRFRTGVSADHVTEQWRVRLRLYSNYNKNVVEGDDEVFESIRRNQGGWGSVAYSLGDHWSVGVGANYNSDSFQNLDHQVGVAPAIEYSLFPYREVMRRELTVAYRLRGMYQDYEEETIYGKMSEGLVQQELRMDLRMRQPWGQIFTGVQGSHFFHDPSKFRVSLNSNVDLRLVRGLAFRVSGNVRLIRDQLSLPGGESSLEDLLLQQRQLATDYDLGLFAGVSYTFGSMYNNIVNTRL